MLHQVWCRLLNQFTSFPFYSSSQLKLSVSKPLLVCRFSSVWCCFKVKFEQRVRKWVPDVWPLASTYRLRSNVSSWALFIIILSSILDMKECSCRYRMDNSLTSKLWSGLVLGESYLSSVTGWIHVLIWKLTPLLILVKTRPLKP